MSSVRDHRGGPGVRDPVRGAEKPRKAAANTGGFSLVELVVAMLILTVGLLAMAGATAYVIRATTLSELDTKRAAAYQAALEEIRAMPFEDVGSGNVSVGPITASWTAVPAGATAQSTKEITVLIVGPGRYVGDPSVVYSPDVEETFTYRLIRRGDS